jgi:hypothetical protein
MARMEEKNIFFIHAIREIRGSIGFVEGEWQDDLVPREIAEHNLQVRVSWINGGGDPLRPYCWHVTEITLDHLRPSPEWLRQMEDLRLAKEAEILEERGLRELAKQRRKEQEKMRLLQEVLELFKTDWPQHI